MLSTTIPESSKIILSKSKKARAKGRSGITQIERCGVFQDLPNNQWVNQDVGEVERCVYHGRGLKEQQEEIGREQQDASLVRLVFAEWFEV